LDSGLLRVRVRAVDAPLSVLSSTVELVVKPGFAPQFLFADELSPIVHQ